MKIIIKVIGMSVVLLAQMIHVYAEDNQRQLAYHQMELAQQAFQQKDFSTGIEHFERAYRHFPSHELLYNIAKGHDQINQNCPARLKAWERLTIKCKACTLKKIAMQSYQKVTQQCEKTIKIESTQGVLSILINDEVYGKTPLSILLPIDQYRIELVNEQEKTVYQGKLTLKKNKKNKSSIQYYWNGKSLATKKHVRKKKRARKKKQALNVLNIDKDAIKVQASLECQYLDQNKKYQAYPECDGAQLQEGDRFRVIFTVSQNAYIYLFLSNDHGDRSMLFPDAQIENQVKPKVEYVLPGAHWYELDHQGNTTERIHLIASTKPVAVLEQSRGTDLNIKALKKLKMMSFRGVRKRTTPAILGTRLKNVESILQAQGTKEMASISLSIQHK